MEYNDSTVISKIIKLVPLYNPETMPDQPSTIPGEDGWGYSLVNFCIDHLEEDFPGLSQQQFSRCYCAAFKLTNQWRDVTGKAT